MSENLARTGPLPVEPEFDRAAIVDAHAAAIWGDLRTNGPAMDDRGRETPHKLVDHLLASPFDDDAMERMFANAASADQKGELYAWHLQAIAVDFIAQVRKLVQREAEARELQGWTA